VGDTGLGHNYFVLRQNVATPPQNAKRVFPAFSSCIQNKIKIPHVRVVFLFYVGDEFIFWNQIAKEITYLNNALES
jgi:hypothetical protein